MSALNEDAGVVPADMAVPRRLRHSIRSVRGRLDVEPEAFLASRRDAGCLSRECLASLFKLASSLHSRRLPYYSRLLETSEARHITVEQIWGQMNMLLRPVLRRLRDNVRQAQRTFRTSSNNKPEKSDVVKRNAESKVSGKEALIVNDASDHMHSARTSELDESELDDEIADLLAQQEVRQKMKGASKTRGDDQSWRYAFGMGNGGDELEEEEGDSDGSGADALHEDGVSEGESGSSLAGSRPAGVGARPRKRSARVMGGDMEDEDENGRANEELEALKEMYGDDFEDEEGAYGDEEDEVDGYDDPLLEEDMKWDNPTAGFDEEGEAYFGDGDFLPDDNLLDGQNGPGVGDDDDEAGLNDPTLTQLQRERLRERRLVERLEQERLYSTQWAMTGEVGASSRPRDALLDEPLDFEHAMKAVPVITEAVTARLEDRIRRRILDANYDDVTRRTALSTPGDLQTTPAQEAGVSTKDSEKSKLSLMDLYEKEYLERVRQAEESNVTGSAPSAEPLTEVEKDELRAIQMWRRLGQHLDALSNFHFTPKPVQEDLAARVRAVEGQAPAITLETVGNFATTREAALAPQDLYRKPNGKFSDVGLAELSPLERRALRRSKKEQGAASKERREKRKEQAKKIKEQAQQLTVK
ncbi:putative Mpp10 protein [Trypanosoma vivax]|uniref:Putative U3 small nucleolar ribonucleoprotein n=1 Tax=Trypanosoma vivax (strain Y486) TaxID=1055687 RepID=G0TT32_TRYVY|nr:putative U3 small nucleolar ribonucleoprotein [Trypanosoma vivax]KAH8619668.1 putative Mpp10 protein [Trypanosoma vivax]CCC47113.1 putative U3 small nucleolar ribonucleoprotein [Trypanosoma vivax Y486]